MLIGILSDTHGRLPAARRGVELLLGGGAQFLVHCGDVGGPDLLDPLAGTPAAFVFGNNDWDHEALRRYAVKLGVQCLDAWGTLELAGKRVAVLHGDDFGLKRKLLDAQEHDYLFQGHTHLKEDRQVGRTRVVNPGALHRAAVKTVALLDTEADALTYLDVIF